MNVNTTLHRTVLAAVIGATLALGVGAPAMAREHAGSTPNTLEKQHQDERKQAKEQQAKQQQARQQREAGQSAQQHKQKA